MFNLNIEPEAESVTLSYLKMLPMFGSIDWFMGDFRKVRTRALFRLDLYSKEQMLSMFKDLRMALLVETLPRANGSNDAFRLKGVNISEES